MSSNPYLDRVEKGINAHGKKSEKKVIEKMGAKGHPNSGAMVGAKSDASLDDTYRLELKSTTLQNINLELHWLVKIAQEALDHGQAPTIVISFVDPSGKPRLRQYAEWVVLPLAVFEELTEK